MMRLGHISLIALGSINLLFALTTKALPMTEGLIWSSRLLIVGTITMPLLCYLSAFHKRFRHLFFIPALCIIAGTAITAWRVIAQ